MTARGGSGSAADVLLLLAVVVVAVAAVPAVSFSTATLDRPATVEVVGDDTGLLGLDVPASVPADEETRLVDVTNRFGESAQVTVTLDSATAVYADLYVGGVNRGNQWTFVLTDGATQQVDVVVTTGGDSLPVVFTVGAATRSVTAEATRQTTAEPAGLVPVLAYEDDSDGQFKVVRLDEYPIATGDSTIDVPGPSSADLDGDGYIEVPYTDKWIHVIDETGENDRIATQTKEVRPAVGDFDDDGTDEIIYVDHHNKLTEAVLGGSTNNIKTDGGGDIKTTAVVGVADFNDDGDSDVVYVDEADKICYLDGSETCLSPTVATGVEGAAVGSPADYDNDGTIEVAYVDSASHISIIDAAGSVTTLNNAFTGAAAASMAAYDWDEDGIPEVVFVNTRDNNYLYYMDGDGSIHRITDPSGTPLDADPESGVA